jgi:tRNA-dihydrouridine synthase A
MVATEDGASPRRSHPHPPVASTRWDSGGVIDSHRISVAPMLECTDTHFRRVCRLLSRRAHLWTEMVNQDAIVHSWRTKPEMLAYGDEEHPLTVQLGGASPERLAQAASICDGEYRYDEINLNCGCPSARVVNKKDADKCFGASLMRDPEHVGECLRRMREAVDVPVTVKHRLGVRPTEKSKDDSTDSYAFVTEFVDTVHQASGVNHFIVHARAAVLSGLSTTGNRTVPPLRHEEVHALCDDFPTLGFSLNGGIETMDQAAKHLASGKLRGVMLGRAVYRNPSILAEVDARFYGDERRTGPLLERYAGEGAAIGAGELLKGEGATRWERDGFAPAADDSVDSNTLQDDVVGSRRAFFRVDDGSEPCVTRRDVLERYSVYGDAVVKMNGAFVAKFPKALTTPRCVAKAINGIGHGARGGGSFRRRAEKEFGEWTVRLLAGESANALSFVDLVGKCAGEIHPDDLDAPLTADLSKSKAHRDARYGGHDTAVSLDDVER